MLDTLLCRTTNHRSHCSCRVIQRHFGHRLFKCGFLRCTYQRHGFTSRTIQARHEKGHTLPWKCDVSGCEYEKSGFLSEHMRDQHLQKAHRNTAPALLTSGLTVGDEDIQSLLLDLIKKNEVESIRLLLPRVTLEAMGNHAVSLTLGQHGSTATVKLILEDNKLASYFSLHSVRAGWGVNRTYAAAIKAHRMDLVMWLMRSDYRLDLDLAMQEVLENGSGDIYTWAKQFLQYRLTKSDRNGLHGYFGYYVIRSTRGRPEAEICLGSLWEIIFLHTDIQIEYLNRALRTAAQTAPSIPLAKALLDHGANVNGGGVVSTTTCCSNVVRQKRRLHQVPSLCWSRSRSTSIRNNAEKICIGREMC